MKRFAGGNPFSFGYILYDSLCCALKLNLHVTLYLFSNKYHNTMLFDLIAIERALCYLNLESL
jgi:hypothetical protein